MSCVWVSDDGSQSTVGLGRREETPAHYSRFCGAHRFALVEIGPRVDGTIVKEWYGFRWTESIPPDLIPEGFGLVLTWGLELLLSPTEDVVGAIDGPVGDVAEPSDQNCIRDYVRLYLEVNREWDHFDSLCVTAVVAA